MVQREETQPVRNCYVMANSKLIDTIIELLTKFDWQLKRYQNTPFLKKSEMSVFDRPTLDEIRSWGKSFDKLMRSPAGRKVFRDFLRCEYSEENILFWLACEELKVETNAEKIEEKARFIYEDYISILSPKEVSVQKTHTHTPTNKNQFIYITYF